MQLTPDQLDAWHDHGWLNLVGALDPTTVGDLVRWLDEVNAWSESGDGPGIHHHEQTEHGPAIARSEHFADDHRELGAFLRGGTIADVLAQLFGEPPVLFKEKVNYKHPDGGGFAPHQDASAYRFVDHHISVMIPVDPATEASGCLWFAPGHTEGLLETNGRGRLTDAVVDRLLWRPLEAHPGDVVFFDSYAPHRSGTNTTDQARRVFYLTYNAASKGDFRDRYYRDKLAEFDRQGETFGDERVRISINDDFLGKPVTP